MLPGMKKLASYYHVYITQSKDKTPRYLKLKYRCSCYFG